MKIFFDGAILDSEQIPFNVDDRAFRYGDGLFETMVVFHHGIRLWDYHWQRLTAGVTALKMKPEEGAFSKAYLADAIHALVADRGAMPARVRLHLWRAGGGLYTPADIGIHLLIRADDWNPPAMQKEQVGVATTVRTQPSPWSRFKTHNSMTYVLAGIERQERALDDLLLLDPQGHVAESCYSNVFWQEGQTWYTPDLSTGCLDGVMRRHIIGQLEQEGRDRIKTGHYPVEALFKADALILTNASGITFVKSLENKVFTTVQSSEVKHWQQAYSFG